MPDFVGRDPIIEDLWLRLQERNLLLIGPRRVGKTSILKAMEEQRRADWGLLYVDLEGLTSEREMVDAVRRAGEARTLWERISGAIGQVESVEVGGILGASRTTLTDPGPWETLADLLASQLEKSHAAHFVVALDEVPWWLDGVEAAAPRSARTVLAQLRRLRADRRLSRVRWIFTGSVGLAGRAHHWNASAEVNDLDIVEVPPLDEAAGKALFETALIGAQVDPDACRYAHALAGGLPHWIRLLVDRVRSRQLTRVTRDDVDNVRAELLSAHQRLHFEDATHGHFDRLWDDPEREWAQAILDHIAQSESSLPILGVLMATQGLTGAPRADLSGVLLRLVDEFYLVESDDRVTFAVPLVRLAWLRAHR